MANSKMKSILLIVCGLVAGIVGMYIFTNYKIEKRLPAQENITPNLDKVITQKENSTQNSGEIDQLTAEETVITFVKENRRLPDYYMTKSEAREQGWIPSEGNLCEVLPGKAIGGDRFSNREKQLPKDGGYYEADVNYNCGNRGAERIVFNKNGEVWLTKNHYKSFEKQ